MQQPDVAVLPPDTILFDWETCSLSPDAALLSLGAIAFNRGQVKSVLVNAENPLYCINTNIDLTSQFINGFHFDADTARWWREKNADNVEGLYVNRREIVDVFTAFNTLIGRVRAHCKDIAFFCRHPHADYIWMREAATKVGLRMPIRHNRIYDVPSYIMSRTGDLKGYIELPDALGNFKGHHAFDDAKRDALQIATVTEQKTLLI